MALETRHLILAGLLLIPAGMLATGPSTAEGYYYYFHVPCTSYEDVVIHHDLFLYGPTWGEYTLGLNNTMGLEYYFRITALDVAQWVFVSADPDTYGRYWDGGEIWPTGGQQVHWLPPIPYDKICFFFRSTAVPPRDTLQDIILRRVN